MAYDNTCWYCTWSMKVIPYFFIFCLLIISFFIIADRGREQVEQNLALSLSDNEVHLRKLFDIAAAYNESTKRQMEVNLRLTQVPDTPLSHPALKNLRGYPDIGIYAYAVRPKLSLENKHYSAMLSGIGSPNSLIEDTKKEISAALSLDLSAPLDSKLYNFIWSYYMSSERFILLAPTIGIDKFKFTDKLHTQPYWLAAIPENNPERKTIFSSIFEDEAGQGKIMTIATPVYNNNEFKGVVALDVGLNALKSELHPYNSMLSKNIAVVADDGLVVVGDIQSAKSSVSIPSKILSDSNFKLVQFNDSYIISSNKIAEKLYAVYQLPHATLRSLVVREIRNKLLIASLVAIIFALIIKLLYSFSLTRKQSLYDGMSKVYNRFTLEERSNKAISAISRKGGLVSLIIIDIDNFKIINDEFGHNVGDEGIRFTADKIVFNVRKSDIVGRYGGEEFVVTLPDTPLEEAVKIAEKIRQDTEQSSFNKNKTITISAGCAQCDTSTDECEFSSLCIKADLALYHSKKKGKNCVTKYSLDFEKQDKRKY